MKSECEMCGLVGHPTYPYLLPGHRYSQMLCDECTDMNLNENRDNEGVWFQQVINEEYDRYLEDLEQEHNKELYYE